MGDPIPEVLSAGTFDWNTEVGPSQEDTSYHSARKRRQSRGIDDDSWLVVYHVTPTAGDVWEEDLYVHITTNPSYNVSVNSITCATVPSPLAHILMDYKNLRIAQIRWSYADAWNTTAHIISTFRPKLHHIDDPNHYLLDFQDASNMGRPMFCNLPSTLPTGSSGTCSSGARWSALARTGIKTCPSRSC